MFNQSPGHIMGGGPFKKDHSPDELAEIDKELQKLNTEIKRGGLRSSEQTEKLNALFAKMDLLNHQQDDLQNKSGTL